MKIQHTPGPWIMNSYMGRQYNIRPARGIGRTGGYAPLAKVAGDARTIDDETMLANARLITASPDLLAALVEIIDAHNGDYLGHGHMDAARVAIAKARGEP